MGPVKIVIRHLPNDFDAELLKEQLEKVGNTTGIDDWKFLRYCKPVSKFMKPRAYVQLAEPSQLSLFAGEFSKLLGALDVECIIEKCHMVPFESADTKQRKSVFKSKSFLKFSEAMHPDGTLPEEKPTEPNKDEPKPVSSLVEFMLSKTKKKGRRRGGVEGLLESLDDMSLEDSKNQLKKKADRKRKKNEKREKRRAKLAEKARLLKAQRNAITKSDKSTKTESKSNESDNKSSTTATGGSETKEEPKGKTRGSRGRNRNRNRNKKKNEEKKEDGKGNDQRKDDKKTSDDSKPSEQSNKKGRNENQDKKAEEAARRKERNKARNAARKQKRQQKGQEKREEKNSDVVVVSAGSTPIGAGKFEEGGWRKKKEDSNGSKSDSVANILKEGPKVNDAVPKTDDKPKRNRNRNRNRNKKDSSDSGGNKSNNNKNSGQRKKDNPKAKTVESSVKSTPAPPVPFKILGAAPPKLDPSSITSKPFIPTSSPTENVVLLRRPRGGGRGGRGRGGMRRPARGPAKVGGD